MFVRWSRPSFQFERSEFAAVSEELRCLCTQSCHLAEQSARSTTLARTGRCVFDLVLRSRARAFVFHRTRVSSCRLRRYGNSYLLLVHGRNEVPISSRTAADGQRVS